MLSIGISPFLMNLCLGLVVFFINFGLMKHGGTWRWEHTVL